ITHVGFLQKERTPADLIFGKENFEFWKTVEQAGQDPLNRGHRTIASNRPETTDLIHQILAELFHHLVRLLWVLEKTTSALAATVEIDVNADLHIHAEGTGPESVACFRRL